MLATSPEDTAGGSLTRPRYVSCEKDMNRKYGLFFSVCVHAMFFLIPVSMIVKQHAQEIELFMGIEDAHMQQAMVKRRHETVKPVVEKTREPEMAKKFIKPVEAPVPEEEKAEIAEPVKKVLQKPTPPEMKKGITVTVQTTTEESSQQPYDTEFGASEAPSFLHREMPVYPLFARKQGKEGKVILRLTIDEKGNLRNVDVVEQAGYGFAEAAVEAVKKSTFLPAKKHGKPVASRALLPVRFSLRRM